MKILGKRRKKLALLILLAGIRYALAVYFDNLISKHLSRRSRGNRRYRYLVMLMCASNLML